MLPNDVMAWPWATALFFAAGYAAYFVANAGIRGHHQQIDVAFSTAIFGFFAIMPYRALMDRGANIYTASAIGFCCAVIVGALWRKWGRGVLEWSLKTTGVSHVNDSPSAWNDLIETKGYHGYSLTVTLKDGWQYQSENLYQFRHEPNGPCRMGANGDILLYPTTCREKAFTEWKPTGSEAYGGYCAEALYLPAAEIRSIEFRRFKA